MLSNQSKYRIAGDFENTFYKPFENYELHVCTCTCTCMYIHLSQVYRIAGNFGEN